MAAEKHLQDDDRCLTTLEVLREVQSCLNWLRRQRYPSNRYKDSYGLAAEIDHHVRWAEKHKEPSNA